MTEEYDESRIDDIAGRLAKISAPSWEIFPNIHCDPAVTEKGRGGFGKVADLSTHPNDYGRANMHFIAHSPDDIAYLLAVITQQQKTIEGM